LNEEIKPFKIFIGWDSREDIAYQVCKKSILDTATVPVEIIPLKQKVLKSEGVYWREKDKLASTEFTFTRFLVPTLQDFMGWALFIDCDFVALEDVKKLFDQRNDKYAVMCAHHDYTPKEGTKMDGEKQTVYPRKNWSSMMLINCAHPSNAKLSAEFVNNPEIDGKYLHRFSWLKDNEIGKLSHEWNWLVGWYKEPTDGKPKFLHYTEGGPWFDNYKNCEYSSEWYQMQSKMYATKVNELTQEIQNLKSRTFEIDDLTLPKKTKTLLAAYLHNLIDPDEEIYKTKETIRQILEENMGIKVAAIAPTADDFDLSKKGLEYDPCLQDFIIGAGGKISSFDLQKGTNNTLVIRGLGGGSQKALQYCIENNIDYYAIDTGYLQPSTCKDYHRITKNNLQNLGPIIERDTDRLSILKWRYKKHKPGKHILVVPPSEKVMIFYGHDLDSWMTFTVAEIKKYTNRPITIRLKPGRTERVTTNTIQQAMENAYCVVTYNSIAATEAILYGLPAIALAPNSARMLCNTAIEQINNLHIPTADEVTAFAAHLSYCQFTLREIRTGYAWSILNESN